MNYATTTKKGKGALRQLLMPLLSILFTIALVCSSFPAPLAYAEDTIADTTSITEAASADDTEESGEGEADDEAKVGTLEVLLSGNDGIYTNVENLVDQTTSWRVDELKTLHVNFEFASGTDKTIAINVPTGYTIVGYSAMDDTPTKDSLTNIEIDPQYKEFFKSSAIVGVDGVTAWEKQLLSEKYLAAMSTGYAKARTYGGAITYTFSDAASEGQLVVTLRPQSMVLSHTAETELLDPITVSMSSAAQPGEEPASIERAFQANVSGLTVAKADYCSVGVWGPQTLNVAYDPETSASQSFGVHSCVNSHRSDTTLGEQPFYVDYWTLTISYPKGVSFNDEIYCRYLGLGDNYKTSDEVYSASGQEIVPGHFTLSVTGDETTGGQVVFAFTNTTFYHSYNIEEMGAYFTADVSLTGTEHLVFTTKMDLENGGKTLQYTSNRYRDLVADDGAYIIRLDALNADRRDVTSLFPNGTFDYALGGFRINSKLPYSNVAFSYDFSDLPGVRGIGTPGYNVRDVVATTTDGRTLQLDSVSGKSNGYYGNPITAEQLGLKDGEYLTTLTCTIDLEQRNYNSAYTNGMTYYGHFVEGQTGDVVLTILDENGEIALNDEGELLTVTDHTNLNWMNSGGAQMHTIVYDSDWQQTSTFLPNERIRFVSSLSGGMAWSDSDTLIDPVIMISLPEGINLDTSSIYANSEYGNHGDESFPLSQVGTPLVMEIDGAEWTTYYFTSANAMDMVATEDIPGKSRTSIQVTFDAYVVSNSPEYGQISLKDCVQWDLGVTSVKSNSGLNFHADDTYNRTGKNTEDAIYKVHEAGDNFTVKPLIGLNVDLGIRVMGSGTDFFTYDTTESSVAGLLSGEKAEVQITYENTASTDYFKGSVVYLPVPQVGNDYDRFFQNIEMADPLNVENNTTFQFDAYLESPVEMDDFTTYYAVDVSESGEGYDPSTNASTWAPVEADWMTYDELTAAGHELSDVVFLKLVADRDIPSGESGAATFELSISENAQLDQVDYWRAYSKAVTDQTDDTGIWNYSSVIAATPVNFGVSGQLFLDLDENGRFDEDAGDEAYSGDEVTAILSRDGGGMDNLLLAVAEDGSFRSLNENGTDYYLKTGNYTITFANSDEVFVYSPIAGAEASSETAWYNDLDAAGISDDTATYHFTVSADTTTGTYVGVALIPEVISIDVPVRVDIALKTDGTWCTPTALANRIINHSTCDIRVASAETTSTSGFSMFAADEVESSTQSNAFGGTIQPQDGTTQDLTDIICPAAEWVMESGFATAGENELALQLAGTIENVEGWFFPTGIHAFDITYTFEKATAGGE